MSSPCPRTEASGVAGSELKTYVLQHPNGFVFGVAAKYDRGWQFIPAIAGRKPSRRYWQTADACLPRWARKRFEEGCSFLPPAKREAA